MLLYKNWDINFQRLRQQKTRDWNDFLWGEHTNNIFDHIWGDIEAALWHRLWIGACRGGEEGAKNFDELAEEK